jgi:hypothetical protein
MQYQQKLLDIIKRPYQLDDKTMAVLQKLTDDYPYCQTLQILLAKNLQEKDKLQFEAQVNKASAYAVDRRKFQRYISDRDKPHEEAKTPEDIKESHDKQVITTVNTPDPKHTGASATLEPVNNQSQPVKSSPLSLVEIVKRRLKEIQERDRISKEKGKTEEQAVPQVTPEPEKEAIIKQPDEKGHEQVVDEATDKLEDKKPDPDSISTPVTVQQENDNINPSPSIEKKSESEPTTTDNAVTDLSSPDEPTEEIKDDSNNSIFIKPDNGSKDQRRKQKKPDIHFLIDKFLKEEPRIQMRKDLPERQEDLSAASTNENPQLVSETLAVVFLKQGKKDKALDIYEKLCLKYPEKSSYFAKKILDINNEINI